ncbi:topoisomerase II-associated protein PAT1 [Myxozyma melibiosi]|uniref:Topoisomerase II-associated protein PAT1 n=1 Tax=Myxozyma melibiosi TaxID=54550 RepID=A0ABR1FCW6_9ASCO
MSFFGFDPSADPKARTTESSFFDDDVSGNDRYDGLAGDLDQEYDHLNDETFGDSAEPVGRDFDFSAQPADPIRDRFESDKILFRQRPVQDQMNESSARSSPAERSGSEPPKFEIPELKPMAALWESGVPLSQQSTLQPRTATAPEPKKFLSLEEVEAQLMAAAKSGSISQPPLPGMPSLHMQSQMPPPQFPQQMMNMQLGGGRMPMPNYPQPMNMPPAQYQQLPYGLQPSPNAIPPSDNQQRMQPPSSHLRQDFRQQQLPPQQHLPLQQQHPLQQQPQHQQQQQYGQHQSPTVPKQSGGFSDHPAANIGSRSAYNSSQNAPHAEAISTQNLSEAEIAKQTKEAYLARYNGLMTSSDKNHVTRLQLQQLVNDDPFTEDFYYQVYTALHVPEGERSGGSTAEIAEKYLNEHGRRTRYGLRRQTESMARLQQRAIAAAKAHPKHEQYVIEGALGKIAFSSGKAPRKILDVSRRPAEI